jgi:antagonist of KipI
MLTTVQDLGRWGHQAEGVPVGGPMDAYSHRLANRLVANDDHAAALEITLVGPELEAEGDLVCAVAGAEFELLADGRPAPCGRAVQLPHGARLRFGRRIAGARASLAVRGGIDVPPVFGSRATSVVSRVGPLGGRPITTADTLPIGTRPAIVLPGELAYSLPLPQGGARLRVLVGPHETFFTPPALNEFFTARFTVSIAADRMGYRLDGPSLAPRSGDVLSGATPFGSIQVPRAGQPILLMADRQTTGGYPRIGTVISADLPLAGQLAPGDWIRFVPCSRAEALEALQRLERRLAGRLDSIRAASSS